MIKALFFDIDGTLVSFRTHTIPVSTVEALTAAKAAGVKIFIATGRPNAIINNLTPLQERSLIDGYITMNGAYCFAGEELIYKSAIPQREVNAIMDYCSQRDIPCIAVGEQDIAVCQPNEEVHLVFHEMLHVKDIPVKPVNEALCGREIFQMTPFITASQELELLPHIPHCEVGRWYPSFVDITAKGNTKQRGMDAIIQHFGLALEETMSFGDGGNDIPMLKHAGIGVAMGNADEQVKSFANYVTTSVDEEGIANALKHFAIID